MAEHKRKIRLGAFLFGVGHHSAAWRAPDVDPAAGQHIGFYQELAQIAEAAAFDAVFFADNVAMHGAPGQWGGAPPVYFFEPTTLLASLAAVTKRIGLIATVSASYTPPYQTARLFASLDHLSGGRAGWNLVTSGSDGEAANFGLKTQRRHADRYRLAGEYVDLVRKLWDSWDDDAFRFDQHSGVAFDGSKVRLVDHDGEHFSVRGPLQISRPVQGHPVIVQAGSSDDGQRLAAHSAEVVFTAQPSLAAAQAFYRGLKQQVLAAGRDPDNVLIMPGIQPFVAETKAEAEDKYARLQKLVDPRLGQGMLAAFSGIDASQLDLDGPLPDLPETEGWKSRRQLFVDVAKENDWTVRQLIAFISAARGHAVVVGTPSDVADHLEAWHSQEAADGFNIMPPTLPTGLTDFTRLVVPELRRRGLFREQYEAETLRGHLGLARPAPSAWTPASFPTFASANQVAAQ